MQFRTQELCMRFSTEVPRQHALDPGEIDRQMEPLIEGGCWCKPSRNEKHILVISSRHTGVSLSLALSRALFFFLSLSLFSFLVLTPSTYLHALTTQLCLFSPPLSSNFPQLVHPSLAALLLAALSVSSCKLCLPSLFFQEGKCLCF